MFPWNQKVGPSPHIQVAPKQEFAITWSTGHGNVLTLNSQRQFKYFIVLKLDDQDKIPFNSRGLDKVIRDYINQAPPGSNMTDLRWRKNQLLPNPATLYSGVPVLDQYNDTIDKYFDRVAKPSDPQFLYRDTSVYPYCKGAGVRYICSGSQPPSQYVYRNESIDFDIRLEYENPNYPWIESLHRFETRVTETIYASSYSAATFRILARKGPGNYIIWWKWGG